MTTLDASLFFTTFTTAFVIADPAGSLPVFTSLTTRVTPNERKRAARQTTFTSLVVLVVFAFFGQQILRLLGISVVLMRISGSLLLLIVTMQLFSGREKDPGKPGVTNVTLVPLEIPLLVDPSVIAVVILAADQAAGRGVGGTLVCVVTMLLVHIIEWLTMRFANPLNRILGEGRAIFLARISNTLLVAIAVQFITSGVTSAIKD